MFVGPRNPMAKMRVGVEVDFTKLQEGSLRNGNNRQTRTDPKEDFLK